MIHLKNTVTTLSTMVSTLWLPCWFANALVTVLIFHVLTQKRCLHALSYTTWISAYTSNKGHYLNDIQTVADGEENKPSPL